VERDRREPRLSDLRESGAIEQDADLVGLLYRPTRVATTRKTRLVHEADALPISLLIAKQRNGPTGEVSTDFSAIDHAV
jgi:replicative DNA helicase